MNRNKPPLRLVIIFVIYICFMIWLLFFFHRSPYFSELSYFDTIKGSINLQPFSTVNRYINALKNGRLIDIALINLIGNIIMFIPLGILLPSLWKQLDSFIRCLIGCFGLILMVEITQLFTLRGSCDVDDLILNLAGCIIGYFIHRRATQSATA
ncbi:MAG: VanZ family protein [Lachnospiraceae bacterium]|nr:VanZ family protein [Lachnospiraceae bacterium]